MRARALFELVRTAVYTLLAARVADLPRHRMPMPIDALRPRGRRGP